MFDIGWSELLVLGVVVLLFVGPKELPAFMRTIGRYAGVLRRHAAEFRSQFDEAMRETELEQLKKDMENVRDDLRQTMHEAETSVKSEIDSAQKALTAAGTTSEPLGSPDPLDTIETEVPLPEKPITYVHGPDGLPKPATEVAAIEPKTPDPELSKPVTGEPAEAKPPEKKAAEPAKSGPMATSAQAVSDAMADFAADYDGTTGGGVVHTSGR